MDVNCLKKTRKSGWFINEMNVKMNVEPVESNSKGSK